MMYKFSDLLQRFRYFALIISPVHRFEKMLCLKNGFKFFYEKLFVLPHEG